MSLSAEAGGLVGFSYTEADTGMQSLKSHKQELEEFISTLEGLKVQNPEEWNGTEEAMYQQLMADAKKGLDKINENIAGLTSWINLASTSHKSNELRNTKVLAAAYEAAQL